MAEQKLCWRCKKRVFDLEERLRMEGYLLTLDILHCHHDEPEEKPKCWCEKTEPQPIIYGMMPNEINFCPQCGRKL